MANKIKEKETMLRDTFKKVLMRREIFFKFTGYSYKLASGWKLTLSSKMPLLPFKSPPYYECITLPKTPQM
jgi:hypothetical protein